MLIIMTNDPTEKQLNDIVTRITLDGYEVRLSIGSGDSGERTTIMVIGESPTPLMEENYSVMEGVDKVISISAPYKLASREYHPKSTFVSLNGSQIGSRKVAIIAGPCSVESRDQIIETACRLKEAGAIGLRGGAFKPRSSPYSFQGHGEKALRWLAEAREVTGLVIVTEVMDHTLIPMVSEYADVLQIGARNMQNSVLLRAAGQTQHPVLLKRGMNNTIEELLMAAEYILHEGNDNVMLCERGIRTFETFTRNTLDINAIPVLKHLTHLPVVADPSHGVGKREYVEAVSRAAVAAGADALIIEVHLDPTKAFSDGRQSLTPDEFQTLMRNITRIAEAVDRTT